MPIILAFVGCGGGGGGGGTVIEGAVITGHVEALGAPDVGLGDVTVELGSRTTTTNEQGWYLFADVDAADRVVVRATRDGYVGASETLGVSDGAAFHVDLILVPAPAAQTVSAASGGTVGGAGAELIIPAGAFVDGSGAPASGDVSITVAVVDPGVSEQAGEAFPGEFLGLGADGEETPLESFGIFAIEARSGDELLDLAPGRTIEARVPIAPSGLTSAPASIALWSFDESSGLWDEEGTATRDGDTYRASIPHLSWWNFDVAYRDQTTCVSVCFEDGDGRPVGGVRVSIAVPIVRSSMVGYTGPDGCVSINVRRSAEATLTASYNGNTPITRTFTTQDLVTNTNRMPPMCQDLGTLSLAPSVAQAILSWGPEPSDLDSHMTGPGAAGRFHTYYGSRGSETSEPYCALDTDDTSAFGPEMISLHRAMSGIYRYSVHNYSGQASHPIESSGATVVLVVPGLGQIVSYQPPVSNPGNGNVWRVFELRAEGSRIIDIVTLNDFMQSDGSSGPAFDP